MRILHDFLRRLLALDALLFDALREITLISQPAVVHLLHLGRWPLHELHLGVDGCGKRIRRAIGS